MQKIFFHKTVDLNKSLKELLSISVDESIQYKLEMNGMRAIGNIVIYGEYDDGVQRNKFKENIELDILATMDKIEDKKDFHVKVEDFDYSLQSNQLKLIIQTCVFGVKDDEDKHIQADHNYLNEIEPHIESLLREEDKIESIIEEKKFIDNATDDQQESTKDEDVGTYYFYIIQDGDSYHTISSRYNIDEKIIRDYNDNREIKEGNIIIVPYIP